MSHNLINQNQQIDINSTYVQKIQSLDQFYDNHDSQKDSINECDKESSSIQSEIECNQEQSQSIENDTYTNNSKFSKLSQGEQQVQNKFLYYVNLYFNVKRTFKILSRNIRIFENLTRQQHALIADKSSLFKKDISSKVDKIKFLVFQLAQFSKFFIRFRQIHVFSPYHFLKRLWDSLVAFLILMVTFLFSLVFFFGLQIDSYVLFFRNCFIIFMVDMCVTFNTGIFKSNGDVLLKRKLIAEHYLKTEFLADLFGLSPLIIFYFDVSHSSQLASLIYLLILLKCVQLKNIFSRLSFYLSYQRNKKNLIDLIKLIFFIVCVCHTFSMFWHGLAIFQIQQGRNDTWLHKMNLIEAGTFKRYIYSFYFLSTTMITVGYGDITPQNTLEVVLTIITMFTTGVVYAYSLNTIGGIINNIERKEKQYKENMQTIHQLMRKQKVDQDLRIKISNYFHYQYKVIFIKYTFNQFIPTSILYNLYHIQLRKIIRNFFIQIQLKHFPIIIKLIQGMRMSVYLKKKLIIRLGMLNFLFYQNIQKSNTLEQNQQKQIIEKLSTQLKNDLLLSIQGKYLKQISLFESMEEKQKICLSMEECQFSPGEYIFKQGDVDDYEIYIIVKGSISIVFSSKDNSNPDLNILTIEKGHFGEISFITGKERSLTVKANDFSRLYKIKRSTFLKIIQDNSHDFELFKMMQDQITTNENYKFNKIKCFSCGNTSHISTNCPKIHYKISKEVYLQKKNYSSAHLKRQYFQRAKRYHFNSRENMDKCLQCIIQINEKDDLESALNFLELGIISISTISEEGDYQAEENQNDNQIQLELNQQKYLSENNFTSEKPIISTQNNKYQRKSLQNNYPESILSQNQLSSKEITSSNLIPSKPDLQFKSHSANKSKIKYSKHDNNKSQSPQLLSSKRLESSNDYFDFQEVSQINLSANKIIDQLNSQQMKERLFKSNTEVIKEEEEGKLYQTKQQNTSLKQLIPLKKFQTQECKDAQQIQQEISFKMLFNQNENFESQQSLKSNKSIKQKENSLTSQSQLQNAIFKRQLSSQFKNQIVGNDIVQKVLVKNKDSNYQQSNRPKIQNQILDQANFIQQLEQIYLGEKKGSSSNLNTNNPRFSLLLKQELQKVSQCMQNMTEKKFENIINIIEQSKQNEPMTLSKNQLGIGCDFKQRNFMAHSQQNKDELAYGLIQIFECFKKFTYFYPHNNYTETIKHFNMFSYEKRQKQQIKMKKAMKTNKQFKQTHIKQN